MHTKIEIKNLNFAYNTQPVLEDINATINKKDIITIIGPNGGGKTTLLRLLLGLLKPQNGTITIDGKSVEQSQLSIGYVPQHTQYDTKFPITVFEVVLSGKIKPFGYYSKNDKLKAQTALEKVGLLAYRNEPFSILSGGQKQKMLIARALITDATLLLLDEPTSNIDPTAGDNLNATLSELNEKITIILVSHDIGFVANISKRVFCVNKTLVEHPVDAEFSKIIASSYSSQSKIVRHDKSLSSHPCPGGHDCG